MPPAYTVRARVVDIRTDTPRPTDRFAVDTNVWAWGHYPDARMTITGAIVPQGLEYPPYLQLTRACGATRYRTGLSLAELAHLIEQIQLEAYIAGVSSITLKDYRHNLPSERSRVAQEVQRVWHRVKADSAPLSLTLDDPRADAALLRLATEPVDGYDLYLLEAMAAGGITQLLTDDGDFCTVAGIEVFTANPRVLAAARTQGRLVVR